MNKTKIALIELKEHPVFLDSLLNILETKEFEISLYLSYDFKNNLANKEIFNIKEIQFNIQKKDEDLLDFIIKNQNNINKNDIVIFLTPDLRILYNIKFESFLILNIHNLNTWINVEGINFTALFKNISPEIKSINFPTIMYNFKINQLIFKSIKIFKYSIVECVNRYKRKNILKKIDAVNLLHPNMNDKLLKQFDKKIFNLPFRIPNKIDTQKTPVNKEYLCVGIMGTVEQQRRDYLGLLSFLVENNIQLNYKLKFIFLGTFKGAKKYKKTIINSIKNIENNNIDFELFLENDFIEQSLFDSKMKEIDIILAPIKRYKYNILYKEEYGVTKATGSDFDAFYYSKPIIMPNFYKSINYLKNYYDFYSNYYELLDLLQYYSNKNNLFKKYQKLNINIIKFKEKYKNELRSLKK